MAIDATKLGSARVGLPRDGGVAIRGFEPPPGPTIPADPVNQPEVAPIALDTTLELLFNDFY